MRFTIAVLTTLFVAAHAVGEPPPSDEAWQAQIDRLANGKEKSARLAAVEWMMTHRQDKGAPKALRALETTVRKDPERDVRHRAVATLGLVAHEHKLPCPLAVVEATLDADADTRQDAEACCSLFKTFAPGSLAIFVRCAQLPSANRRCVGLLAAARAGSKDKDVLKLIETAKQDKDPFVRHHAYVASFHTNEKLDGYLPYLVRLVDDMSAVWPVDASAAADPDMPTPDVRKVARNLAVLGAARLMLDWSENRPDEMAAVMLQMLGDKSPAARRAAVNRIGTLVLADKDRKSKLIAQFEKKDSLARIRKLSQSDPDQGVRKAALEQLEKLCAKDEKRP